MVAGLIVTHGALADALLETSRMIVGELPHVAAVCLDCDVGPESIRDQVHAAIDAVDQGDGVLILADLLGGTPCNAGLQCVEDRHIAVVTGVNLSMVVRIAKAQRRGDTVEEAAREIAAYGSKNVTVASDALRGPKG